MEKMENLLQLSFQYAFQAERVLKHPRSHMKAKLFIIVICSLLFTRISSATICTAVAPEKLHKDYPVVFIAQIDDARDMEDTNANGIYTTQYSFKIEKTLKGNAKKILFLYTRNLRPGEPNLYKAWTKLKKGDRVYVLAERDDTNAAIDNCLGPSVSLPWR